MPHPPFTGQDVRSSCLHGIQDATTKQRIASYGCELDSAEDRFHRMAERGDAAQLEPEACSQRVHSDMVWYYEKRLIASAPGRTYVSALKSLTKNKCAYCHIALATTLDHSFPKSRFPKLAMDPLNLVPTCRDCNLGRNIGSGSLSISPYYDHWMEDVAWLQAHIIDVSAPEVLRFSPRRHTNWTDTQWGAVQIFFEDSDLDARYADQAIDEYVSLSSTLTLLGDTPTSTVISQALSDRHYGYISSLGPNRWQTVAYEAWAAAADIIDWSGASSVP